MLRPRYGWSMRQASALLLVPDRRASVTVSSVNYQIQFKIDSILNQYLSSCLKIPPPLRLDLQKTMGVVNNW